MYPLSVYEFIHKKFSIEILPTSRNLAYHWGSWWIIRKIKLQIELCYSKPLNQRSLNYTEIFRLTVQWHRSAWVVWLFDWHIDEHLVGIASCIKTFHWFVVVVNFRYDIISTLRFFMLPQTLLYIEKTWVISKFEDGQKRL